MKRTGKMGISLLAAVFVLCSSCLYTRIDEQLIKRRHYQEFNPKQYLEPTQYLSADGINYAFIEKGQGPTIVLMHGGVMTMDMLDSWIINPAWDTVSAAVPVGILYYGIPVLTASTTYALAGILGVDYLLPPRAQSLIHFGAVSTIDTWQYNFEELAKNFNVIALDLPGFGSSSKPDVRYTVPEMTHFLNQFLEAKGVKKAVLVGQDFSGLIAIDYALAYPDKVSGLVLISPYGVQTGKLTPLYWHYPRWVARHAYRDKAARVDVWRSLLKIYGDESYQKLFYVEESKIYDRTEKKSRTRKLIWNDSEPVRKWVEQIVKYKFESGWMKTKEFTNELYATHMALTDTKRLDYGRIAILRDQTRTDWVTRIKDIKTPTLIIRGKYDPVLPYDDAVYMDEVMPFSTLSNYLMSSHYPMVEEPEKFNNDVIKFVGGVAPVQE